MTANETVHRSKPSRKLLIHKPTIRTFLSEDHLALGAVQEVVRLVNSAIETRGICRIALSGGETPRRLYGRLAKAPFAAALDWNKVHVFFGDERAVPPSDPQSNFGMVDHELLSHIDIPGMNIHRIHGELSPEEAARRYQMELEDEFEHQEVRFDLVLLGLGEDGHTASLFPKTRSVLEELSLVCSVYVPLFESWRITLTFRAINDARRVLFLVAGGKKAAVLDRVLSAPEPIMDLPATMVLPKEGTLMWMIDGEAAMKVKERPGFTATGQ
jgi:6-phosphogluconolactonase